MTKRAWGDAWGMLTATFGEPHRTDEENDAKAVAYARLLGDTDDASLDAAVIRACRECQRFPTVKDILERLPGRLTDADAAEAAWQRVLHSARHGPTRYNPALGTRPTGADLDPAALSAIGHAAGLYRLWEVEEDPQQLGFMRRDFIETFRNIAHMGSNGILPTGEPREQIEAPRGGGIRRIGGPVEFVEPVSGRGGAL